jgi:hypothetical protein
MTHRFDVADSRDLFARWCILAEHRLHHLTELFESGRWRRYYSELAFLQNIQEAKAAVETWRALAARGPLVSGAVKGFPTREIARDVFAPPPFAQVQPSRAIAHDAPALKPVVDLAALERALKNAVEPGPDSRPIEQRYPLLRNAMYS